MQTPSESKSGRNHDEKFLLSVIPHLAIFVRANIPNLNVADTNKDFKIKIYNEDTCTEYHDLLCELLDHYSVSLHANRVAETQTEATTQMKKLDYCHLRLVLLLVRSLREMGWRSTFKALVPYWK